MKYAIGIFVRYNDSLVRVVGSRYNEKLNEWFYEIENKKNDFKAWVSENKLTT
jgi:hypothetical protein